MFKRTVAAALLTIASVFISQQAIAQDFQEGVHYKRISPAVTTSDKSKIEVLEFFWYGCGHCYHFEPLVKAWKGQQADDVVFVRSPAIWNNTMRAHAKLYYAVKLLKVLDKVDDPLFSHLTANRRALETEDQQVAFVSNYGVDADAFRNMYKQFGVESMVAQADSRARSVRIEGTPELLVNGKYRITADMAGGQPQMLQVASYLVELERKARAQ